MQLQVHSAEGPCAQTIDTLAQKYPNKDYFKAKVSTFWIHGPLGFAPLRGPGCHLLLKTCLHVRPGLVQSTGGDHLCPVQPGLVGIQIGFRGLGVPGFRGFGV